MQNTSDIKIKNILPDLLNDLPFFIPNDSKTKVINYKGQEGLEQVTLNSTKAKGEILLFEIENMSSFLNYGFCEDVRKTFVKNKIHIRELTNQSIQESWTKIEEFVNDYWTCRYIDPNILKMNIEVLIYNDVVAFYNYKDGDIFCVEIYNQKLADMQKQIFDFMWHYGKEVKVGEGGSTSL